MNRLSFLSAIALIVAPTSLAQSVANLSGEWSSSWGTISLNPTDDGYRGTYSTDNGFITLQYTVSGEYEGLWSEDRSSIACDTPHPETGSFHWGRLKFDAPREREPFSMKWGYCDGEVTQDWNVTPIQSAAPENSQFYGNWRVNWLDSSEPEAFLSIYRDYEWDCTNREDSWCQKRVKPNAAIVGRAGQNPQALDFDRHPGIDSISLEGGELTVDWGFGHLQHWGGVSKLRMESRNQAGGEWRTNFAEGKEVWTRVQSRAVFVESDRPASNSPVLRERKPVGSPVSVHTKFLGPNASMRGNRPKAILDIYGENLWGEHEFFLPRQTGIEISGMDYICANRNVRGTFFGAQTCMDEGGVIGRRLTLVFWTQAAPGIKVLRLNDQLIPFKVEIENYPQPVVIEPSELRLSHVVLLDDQLGQRQEEGARVKDYTYPYDDDGNRRSGLSTRMLALVGENLTNQGGPYLTSTDGKISYERMELPDNIQGAVRRAATGLGGAEISDDEEVLLVRATLENGVRQGVKSMYINGQRGNWSLLFANPFGRLQFLKEGTTQREPLEDTVYFGETIRVGVQAVDSGLPIDQLEIILEAEVYPGSPTAARNASRQIGRYPVTVANNDELPNNYAVSQNFLVLEAGAATNPTPRDGETPIQLSTNERLVTRMADRFSLVTVPPALSAPVLRGPRRGDLWQSALNKVATCVGGDAYSDDFVTEQSTVFENWLLTEAVANAFSARDGTRRTRITKGDHAALILIRDEILPIIEAANGRLANFTGTGQPGETKAQSYYSQARSNPRSRQNSFWTARVEENVWVEMVESTQASGQATPVPRDIFLVEMLDFQNFQTKITDPRSERRPNIRDTQDRINKIVSKHIDLQYNQTIGAIGDAIDAGDCSVADLLVIAGQRVNPAIASLLPDLVKQENGRWRPDTEARAYVKSVYVLGAEVRTMRQYAQLDEAYKAMAIAVVAAPAAYAGAAFAASGGTGAMVAGSAFTALATGADIFDMAYFGRRGLEEYTSLERDYFTALGLTPVLSKSVIDEARASRGSGLAALAGLVAPGLSAGGGLSALNDIRRVANGRALARSGRDLSSLDDLSESERLDLLAYQKHLTDSAASTTARLGDAAQEDMALLEKTLADWQGGSRADDFDFLDMGDLGSSRPSATNDTLAESGSASRTEFDPNAGRNQNLTALDREPQLRLPEETRANAESLPVGEASKHLSNRDIAKLMQLRRPLTPDEQIMRDDLLRQWINNPEAMTATQRRIMESATGQRYAGRFAPVDDSPVLPPSPQRINDFLESRPGAYSDHLTDAQVRELFEGGVGAKKLTPDEIITKMDLMRNGRAPASAATDPELHAALKKVFERRKRLPKTEPLGPNGTEIEASFTPPTNNGPNGTNIEPPFTPPGAATTDPNQTLQFDQAGLEPLARIPSNTQLEQVGPFRGIVAEEMYPDLVNVPARMKRMPAGTRQMVADPNAPMILDARRSTRYLYTVMPNGEVRYIPQEYVRAMGEHGEIVRVERFKHSMLTEGRNTGQSGEINFINGRWVIDSESGRYGAYAIENADGSMTAISRSRESLDAARDILTGYRVRDTNGQTINLETGYVERNR